MSIEQQPEKSLGSFLLGIWRAVKKFFLGLDARVKALLPIAIIIVQNIKDFVDSPGADVITEIIKGDWDDKLKDSLRKFLPKFLLELRIYNDCVQLGTVNEQLACIIKNIQLSGDDAKDILYHGLASKIMVFLSEHEGIQLTWKDAVEVAELLYQALFKNIDPSLGNDGEPQTPIIETGS